MSKGIYRLKFQNPVFSQYKLDYGLLLRYTRYVSAIRRITRPLRHGFVLVFFYFFVICVNFTPRKASLCLWGHIARYVSIFFDRERAIAVRNITRALKIDENVAVDIFKATLENFAKNLVDLAYFTGPIKRDLTSVITVLPEDFAIIENAMAAGKGVIGITGHISNWELFGGFVASRLNGIHVIAREAYDRYTDRILRLLRRRMDVTSLYTDEPASAGSSIVRGGEFLGVLADLNVRGLPAVTVDFFGRPASTPVGPALLSRRTGAPLIPMCIVREENDSYRVYITEPITPANTGDFRSDLTSDTQAWSTMLEAWIKRFPGQWIWLHDRWPISDVNSNKRK
jgi:KDO2-lipid IV(A) lauroyltransferase